MSRKWRKSEWYIKPNPVLCSQIPPSAVLLESWWAFHEENAIYAWGLRSSGNRLCPIKLGHSAITYVKSTHGRCWATDVHLSNHFPFLLLFHSADCPTEAPFKVNYWICRVLLSVLMFFWQNYWIWSVLLNVLMEFLCFLSEHSVRKELQLRKNMHR